MFKDKVKLKVEGGHGGRGHVSFDIIRKPNGGNGGNGGNVVLEGTIHVYDYFKLNTEKVHQASNGVMGGKNNLTGANADDLVIKVPLTTNVFDSNGDLIGIIDEDEQRITVAKGGRGGIGNNFYRGKGMENREKFTVGHEGESHTITLELELMSDVIFIGLPNVGKSSILKELTNADAKIAHYQFTTIDPQLGRMGKFTLMDLPGLIEGTYEGKGVGTKFVKHTRRAKLIAHFVSMDSEDLVADYNLIRKEIENIGEGLADKKEIVVLTKSDEVDEKERAKIIKNFEKKTGKKVEVVSILVDTSLEQLGKRFEKELS